MPTHVKTGSTGSMPYPSLPASPTLTNPDMILPDYDDAPSYPERSESPLERWKSNQASDMQAFDLNSQAYQSGPITPTTPIIYGNGTMLSDIGEVTEAESVRGPASRLRMASRNGFPETEVTLHASSNSLVYDAIKQKKHLESRAISRDRRGSIESTSTITNGDRAGVFADFDDAVSVDDTNFQGDDEESVAESYVYDDASVAEETRAAEAELHGDPELGAEERYSTALSRRAEQILANAKRRLSTMEGNLTRARTSLSISSIDSGSTPSPPMARPATALHRDHESKAMGHSRILSENNLPTEEREALKFPRSSSALGAAGGYRQPLHNSRGNDYVRESSSSDSAKSSPVYGSAGMPRSKSSLHESRHTLEPLDEDEVPEKFETPRQSIDSSRLDSFLSPTFGSFAGKELKRSASATQMRDIKDQMKDLKGRLSTLRDQARADSLKRRSLSSLRTPSPFTHARVDQWYSRNQNSDEADEAGTLDSASTDDEGRNRVVNQVIEQLDEEVDNGSGFADSPTDPSRVATSLEPLSRETEADEDDIEKSLTPTLQNNPLGINTELDREDEARTEDGYDDAALEDRDDSLSESGDSLYHDSVQHQVSHEDREDAFDYEHFFLHSAMGSMSQKRLKRRGSNESFTSESSVETTRGPTAGVSNDENALRRRASNVSTATDDSFLTATEGRSTRTDTRADLARTDEMDAEWEQINHSVRSSTTSRAQSPVTAKRATFGFGPSANLSQDSGSEQAYGSDPGQRRSSIVRRPQSSAAIYTMRNCPSVSSFESTGTNRSFPLVNRPKTSVGLLTPSESPDQELKQISETIMSETASVFEGAAGDKAVVDGLRKEDQILVERLVASLGRCVLGLSESGRASSESRAFRRRVDAARQILDGLGEPS